MVILILAPGASRRIWRQLKAADESGAVLARHGQVVVLTSRDWAATVADSAARFGRVIWIEACGPVSVAERNRSQ